MPQPLRAKLLIRCEGYIPKSLLAWDMVDYPLEGKNWCFIQEEKNGKKKIMPALIVLLLMTLVFVS
jgi:hypothetical protein